MERERESERARERERERQRERERERERPGVLDVKASLRRLVIMLTCESRVVCVCVGE